MESYSVKLGDIVNCLDYKRIPISSKEREKKKGPYPYYGAQGIVDYIDNYIFDGMYMLVAEDGENLRSQNESIAQIVKGKYWVNNHAHILESNGKCDIRFVCYYLNTLNIRGYITGSAQPKLNQDNLLSIKMILPSLKMQKELADVLDKIDSKISLNTRMNAELEAMAKQLYDYWFVQFDFPDENGNPYKSSGGKMVYNPTLKREIPAGWEVKSLNQLAQTPKESINPFENPERDYKHYSIPAFDACGSYLVEKGEVIQSNKFIVNKGQILVPKLNPWYNRVILVDSNEYSICSTEFVILDAIEDYVKGFLFYTVKTDSFISYCTKGSTGTSHSQRRVPPEILKAYNVPYNKDVASSFTACVMQQLSMINRNMNEIKQLTHLRDSLLPMLMNGQVTVE